MKPHALLMAAVVLAAGAAIAAQPLPHFKEGTPYPVVRAKLLKSGWKPVRLASASACEDERCKGLPEAYFCAGVGRATCIYTWRSGDRLIRVFGVGEGAPQTFDAIKGCDNVNPKRVDGGVCR